jgi:NADH:ubiquinone oxidoreductase subunit 5 (subunit L)/multisubunit Na+/H+ antiporter MnhA subunit
VVENLILFCLCISLVFLGAAIIRVGLRGQYLGGLKPVSNVRKYPAEPNWYHRLITVALGVLVVLFGIAFIYEFVLSAKK